jgi:excisionase family DNA binding protein
MDGKYYTVEQIAEMLQIHPKTIQRYIREGKLRANKIERPGASTDMI